MNESLKHSRKRVFIDWTYYERGNPAAIAASFEKDDRDYIAYVRERDVAKEIKEWRLAAETWKKAFNKLVRDIKKRGKK